MLTQYLAMRNGSAEGRSLQGVHTLDADGTFVFRAHSSGRYSVSLLRETSALFHIFLTREEAITYVLDHSDLPSAGLAVPVATRTLSAAEAHVIEAHSVAPIIRAQRRDIFERASSAASAPLPVQTRSALVQSVLDDARTAQVARTNSALSRLAQAPSIDPPTTVPDEFASACSPSRDLLALALDSPIRLADRVPNTRPDRVSLTLRPEYLRRREELRDTTEIAVRTPLEPSVTSDTAAESPPVAARRFLPFRFSVREPSTAIPATRSAPAHSPSSADLDNHAWPDSLHESEFFSRFCTCRTQYLCLAHTLLFLPQHEPSTGTAASLVRSNRRLLRAALRDRDAARSHLSSS